MNTPPIENEYDEGLLKQVNDRGYAIIGIPWKDRPDIMMYSFSMGLFKTAGVSEVAMFGVPGGLMEQAIDSYAGYSKGGKTIRSGNIASGLMGSVRIYFKDIPKEVYPKFFGYLAWFYQQEIDSVSVRQMFFPDRNNKYPWDSGCDRGVKAQFDFAEGKHWPI